MKIIAVAWTKDILAEYRYLMNDAEIAEGKASARCLPVSERWRPSVTNARRNPLQWGALRKWSQSSVFLGDSCPRILKHRVHIRGASFPLRLPRSLFLSSFSEGNEAGPCAAWRSASGVLHVHTTRTDEERLSGPTAMTERNAWEREATDPLPLVSPRLLLFYMPLYVSFSRTLRNPSKRPPFPSFFLLLSVSLSRVAGEEFTSF